MNSPVYLIQGSSRSWSGGRDLCMMRVDDKTVMDLTLENTFKHAPAARVIVCAPKFDEGGLDFVKAKFSSSNLSIHASHDDSPVDRLVAACSDLPDDAYVTRVDALHFCWDAELNDKMLAFAQKEKLDCVKLPDDFPVHFASEVYRVGALRKIAQELARPNGAIFRVHPRFYFFTRPDLFNCRYFEDFAVYSDDVLSRCRAITKSIYAAPRQEVNEASIWAGNQLSFHYELAKEELCSSHRVLDIACGSGYGARLISDSVAEVYGGDIDEPTIEEARRLTTQRNAFFEVADVYSLPWPDKCFDVVLSMETIEHIDPVPYLKEIQRVLKVGGKFILSTPQNRMGHIPINSCHVQEFSIDGAVAQVQEYFRVTKVVGIKGGRIVVPGDPSGSNMMLFSEKSG